MTTTLQPEFIETDLGKIAEIQGKLAIMVDDEGKLSQAARRVNRLSRGAVERFVASGTFADMKEGEGHVLSFPAGMAAEAVQIVKLPRRPSPGLARRAGAAMGKFKGKAPLTVLAGPMTRVADIALGIVLMAYDFDARKSGDKDPAEPLVIATNRPEEAAADYAGPGAVADGVFFTRDLVNEPSNILTTTEFAERLVALKSLGVTVEVLEEDELAKLGMRTLLAVGQGSESPSKVVVMQWQGGGKEKPIALVGKGVVFDTGGISIKPAAGMEDMTMDMGGAGVVSGVMKAVAARKAKANVVGIVGLVENMPDGKATRPGDVVTSMKGDTVEIINTDAEGRLVLADCLWYTQDRFAPAAMINLATLTGAIIIGLGHENAGVFSNDDDFCKAFLKAAEAEEEGAWRMPMGPKYDQQLKSRVADMKNVGGRPAGSITAAQFLQRFVRDGQPWIHLDIAGVALTKTDTDLAPKGATGWGVRAIDRLIRDSYEAG